MDAESTKSKNESSKKCLGETLAALCPSHDCRLHISGSFQKIFTKNFACGMHFQEHNHDLFKKAFWDHKKKFKYLVKIMFLAKLSKIPPPFNYAL